MPDVVELIKESQVLEGQQRYNEALKLLQEGQRKQPGERRLAIRLGQLLETTKQYPLALSIYKQLIELRPESQEAELAIGMARCLLHSKRYDQAAKAFSRIYEKLPQDVDVLTGLAVCKRHKGANDEAKKILEHVLKLRAGYKWAVHELAEVQIAQKQDDEAISTLETNIQREDLYGDSLDLWLATLKRVNRERYAQEQMAVLAKQFPHKVEFTFGCAVLAHRNGETTLARPLFEKSDELSPNNYKILHEWGVMERIAGNIERSQELIARSLELKPDQPSALRTYGSDHKHEYGDAIFRQLNMAAAALAEMEPIDQVHIHYAQAKALEDVGELDAAYRHYALAGNKKRGLENYSERSVVRMFGLIPKVVTAQSIAATPQNGYASEAPVFILGMPRSGTSLMEQILSSHPDIFGAGELKFLTGIVDNIQVAGHRLRLNEAEPVFPYEEQATWETRGRRYVEKLEQLAPKPYKRIVDKMPGNFTMVGLIHAILPNAKIIHSRRHPVETCLSCYRIHFAEGQLWSYNLRELGRYYRHYWNLMQHWREQFPGVMYEVRYEDNVADVEKQARALIAHLGLEWHEGCLEFYNTDRPVMTASASQVRKPIYKTSVNRWRKYEKHLGPLLDEIGDIVEQYEAEIAHLAGKNDAPALPGKARQE